MTQKQRYEGCLAYWRQQMPHVESELKWENPFQLLVAVMLSAQCTDRRVNMTTPALFSRFPNAQAMAAATVEEVYELVKSISYPNAKAEHLVGMAKRLVEAYGGEVPNDHDALQTLPGVGRKTANVVTAVAFGQPRIAVDTHVFRVSNRIGLTRNSKTPLETERTLSRYIPDAMKLDAHHWILLHGRYVCTARAPHCDRCGITSYCARFSEKWSMDTSASVPTSRRSRTNASKSNSSAE